MKPCKRSIGRGSRAPVLFLLLLAGTSTWGQPGPKPLTRSETLVQIREALRVSDGHPNEKRRLYGMRAYVKHDFAAAAEQFELAARFADKYAQHRLSLMYWEGEGVPRDRALAYVWSDLAAERGTTKLVAIREKMWASLNPAEQAQAIAIGPEHYARFGDAVAKPRTDHRMRRFALKRPGSRAGWDGADVEIVVPSSGQIGVVDQSLPVSTDSLYGKDRVVPARYWRIQDAILGGGTVEVGSPDHVKPDTEQGK